MATKPKTPDLPACCIPSDGASRAEILYCAYNEGGPAERAGLAWNGLPCPTWADLELRASSGDDGAFGVVDKWNYVALK